MERHISSNMSLLALREPFILAQESAPVLIRPESAVSAD